jgi:hypothetical protein
MQYFMALKVGEKRVKQAREYLNKYTNGTAMPALALKDNKTNVWEPVGEENLYAILNDAGGYVLTDVSGYMVVLCDKNGISKAIARGLNVERKDAIVKMLQADNIQEYKGQVSLPVEYDKSIFNRQRFISSTIESIFE